jgi:hypothetical protein
MYEGDVERLRRIFHPRCWLFGENRSGSHEFHLSGFLDQIASEPIPKAEGEPFDMRLVSVERTGSVAVAKVEVRYQSRRYTDYLTLHKAHRRQALLQPGLTTWPPRPAEGGGGTIVNNSEKSGHRMTARTLEGDVFCPLAL